MKIIRKIISLLFSLVMVFALTITDVFAAPAYDAEVNEKNALALLQEYDKDGYRIVSYLKSAGRSNFEVWLRSESSNAASLDTAVHEEFHQYSWTKNGGHRYENGAFTDIETIYLENGKEIIVPFTSPDGNNQYKTENFTASLSENMRTFRYEDYVSAGSMLSSNENGVYGLLNEYAAYRIGFNNQMKLYPYYSANNRGFDFFSSCINNYEAYEEFRYWTLGLLNHEKKYAPKYYKVHMNNIDYINAYCYVTMQFRNMISQFKEYAKVLTDSKYYWIDFESFLTEQINDRKINTLEKASSASALKKIEDEMFAKCTIILPGQITPVTPEPSDPVTAFVTRLYRLCLNREPDKSGLNDWVSQLKTGRKNAAQVVYGFFFSKEMIGLSLSDDEYVERCYSVMMDRKSDAGGKKYWLEHLTNGVTRLYVVRGFVESNEFTGICNQYGVTRGSLTLTDPRDQNYGITSFVARCYTKALGRNFDEGGLTNWVNQILYASNRKQAAIDTASTGFFHSQEFRNKNLGNTEYVKVLYRTFLGREYDESGLKYWVGHLKNKTKTRDEVLYGFAWSKEFNEIMAGYGIY